MGNKPPPKEEKVSYGKNELWIGTLNFEGEIHSPFEFYSGKSLTELQHISNIFREIAGEYWP